MRAVIVTIRVFLALAILYDVPIIIEILAHLTTGGLRGVNGWIGHIALTGRPFLNATVAEERTWINQAYMVLVVMFVVPLALYFLQRQLARRLSN
jgi:hypothetical protein